jgi:hypothetical protein
MMDHLVNLRTAFFAGLLVLLAACGGSEGTLNGSNGGGNTGGGDTPVDSTHQPASLRLLSQNSQIPSDSSSGTELTAIVRDSNNNFLSGVSVTFKTDTGGLLVTPASATTNDSGKASATLDAAGDPKNRTITVEAEVASSAISDSLQVGVTGTTLSIAGPSSVTAGDEVEYLISLRDSSGTGVDQEEVEYVSSLGNIPYSSVMVTDTNGELTITYSANSTGDDQLTVTALGLNQSQAISVSDDTFEFGLPTPKGETDPPAPTQSENGAFEVAIGTDINISLLWKSDGSNVDGGVISLSTTRGTLADSSVTTVSGNASTLISSTNTGPAVVTAEGAGGPSAQLKLEFIAQNPTAIDVQASPSSIGPNDSSTITAVVRDEKGNPVKNQSVIFSIVNDVSGGSISSGPSETDSLGRAQAVFIAGDAETGKDGVDISATVRDDTSVSRTVTLTVADKALFVTIGSDYLISKEDGGIYTIDFAVIVSDSSGNPVEGVSVDLSSSPLGYSTGCLELTADNVDNEGNPNPESPRCGDFSGTAGKYTIYREVSFCPNEDLNNNGTNEDLDPDPGEDTNSNGTLEPGYRTTIEGNVITDSSGRGIANFSYLAEYAFWYDYQISATASVVGTETTHTLTGTLPALVTDLEGEASPPNETSPFGTNGC